MESKHRTRHSEQPLHIEPLSMLPKPLEITDSAHNKRKKDKMEKKERKHKKQKRESKEKKGNENKVNQKMVQRGSAERGIKRYASQSPIDKTTLKKKQKKTATQTIEEKEVQVKQGYNVLQYRSSLVALIRLLKDLTFTTIQKAEIQKSPFGNLIQAIISNKVSEQNVRKCDEDAMKVVTTYQRWRGTFKLGQKYVRLTDQDITLIFGIKSGGTRIELAKHTKMPNTDFVSRVFQKKERIKIVHLKEYFLKAMKKKTNKGAKDVARLLTLFLIATLFCATTGPTISWSYIKYVENIEDSTSYAWSTHIKEFLLQNLDEKYDNPKTVNGCVIALLYWLCEHVDILPTGHGHQFPRFVKWTLPDLSASLQQSPLETIGPEKVNASELELTTEENNMLTIIKLGKQEEKEFEEINGIDEQEQCGQEKAEEKGRLEKLNVELQQEIKLLKAENERMKKEINDKDDTIVILEKSITLLEQKLGYNKYRTPAAQHDSQHHMIHMVGLEKEIGSLIIQKDIVEEEKKEQIIEKQIEVGSILLENDIVMEQLQQSE